MSFQENAGFSWNSLQACLREDEMNAQQSVQWASTQLGLRWMWVTVWIQEWQKRTLNQFSLLETGLEGPLALCCPCIVWWSFLLPKWARAVEISVNGNRPHQPMVEKEIVKKKKGISIVVLLLIIITIYIHILDRSIRAFKYGNIKVTGSWRSPNTSGLLSSDNWRKGSSTAFCIRDFCKLLSDDKTGFDGLWPYPVRPSCSSGDPDKVVSWPTIQGQNCLCRCSVIRKRVGMNGKQNCKKSLFLSEWHNHGGSNCWFIFCPPKK